jgi:hypothetical protein
MKCCGSDTGFLLLYRYEVVAIQPATFGGRPARHFIGRHVKQPTFADVSSDITVQFGMVFGSCVT